MDFPLKSLAIQVYCALSIWKHSSGFAGIIFFLEIFRLTIKILSGAGSSFQRFP